MKRKVPHASATITSPSATGSPTAAVSGTNAPAPTASPTVSPSATTAPTSTGTPSPTTSDPQTSTPAPTTDPTTPVIVDIPQVISGSNDRASENGLAWDIISQTAQLVRSADARNPIRYGAKNRTEQVYGFGYSQTGGYLYDYINGIKPLVESAPDQPLCDGYIVAVATGAFVGNVPINQCATVPPVTDPRYQFSGVGVPIMHVVSQSDYLVGIAGRRLDSDAPIDQFRHYEMAGAGHATPDEPNYAAQPADILKAGQPVPPMSCNEGPRSRFPSQIFFNAILRNLDDLVRDGTAPPHGSPIVVVNGEPLKDDLGNVLGGLRSPYLDVPTSTWEANSTGRPSAALPATKSLQPGDLGGAVHQPP